MGGVIASKRQRFRAASMQWHEFWGVPVVYSRRREAATGAVRYGSRRRIIPAVETDQEHRHPSRITAHIGTTGGIPRDPIRSHSEDYTGGKPGSHRYGDRRGEEFRIYVAGVVQPGREQYRGSPINRITAGYNSEMPAIRDYIQ